MFRNINVTCKNEGCKQEFAIYVTGYDEIPIGKFHCPHCGTLYKK